MMETPVNPTVDGEINEERDESDVEMNLLAPAFVPLS